MNKVYKSVWNESVGAWVAVSETAATRGKKSSGRARASLGLSAMAVAGASLGLPSAATADQVAIGAGSVASGSNTTAIGTKAISSGANESIAIGSDVQSTANDALSIGSQIRNAAASSIVIGSNDVALDAASTQSVLFAPDTGAVTNSAHSFSFNPYGGTGTSNSSDAINLSGTAAGAIGGVTIGSKSSVTAANTVALGAGARASVANSVALGANSAATRANTVSVGAAGKERQIVNIAAGTDPTDAVNMNQLTTGLAGVKSKYLSALDASGSTAGAAATGVGSIAIGGNAVADSTGGLHAALAIGSDSRAITQSTVVGPGATATASNTVVLGTYSIGDRAGTVSVGNDTNKRQIVNVAAGTEDTDVVNVNQLQSVTSLLGGGAALKADGTVKAPTYTVAGATANTVGDAVTKIDTALTSKVAYDSLDHSQVTLGGTAPTAQVKLTNVKAADLNATSTDAVNGSQLFGTNQRVGSLETFETNISNGGGIKYFHSNSTLADSSATGADAVAIGGAAVATADNSVAIGANSAAARANTVSVGAAGKERQITNVAPGSELTDATNVGQLNALSDVAVKYDTNPNGSVNYQSVTLGGSAATKPTKITNLIAADLGTSSLDAVNGSQLYGTNQRVGSLETFETNINNGGGIKYFHSNSSQADSSATGADAVAIGGSAQASANNSVALGANSVANRKDSVSVGAAGNERQITNVAAGTQGTDVVNVNQLQSVTTLLGNGATLNADGTVNAPVYTVAGATANTVGDAVTKIDTALTNKVAYDSVDHSQVTLGGTAPTAQVKLTNVKAADLSATSTDAVNGSQLYGTNQRVGSLETFATDINNGGGIKYFHTNSTLGDSSATGADSVAVGGAAVASAKNAVALGSNSVADRDNTVSVGAAGHERQITNVAAGTAPTDAVNFGQLTSVSQDVAKLDSFAVKYDTLAGQPNYESVTLGGAGATKPTKLTNLKIGDLTSTSTDAINGSQLYSTNQRVGSLETFEGNINNGGGIKYFHTNSLLVDSLVTGKDSVAIGGAANASADNAVALGSNSVADRANAVSVGAAGHERQVTNVAAGTALTDAVNVGQLTAVSDNLDTLGSFAVKYDTNTDGTPNYEQITLGGAAATKPTLLTNLANGKLTADSTDAVNGSQLYATNQNVSALQDFTNNVNNGGGIKYFHSNSTLADSSATGTDSVAIGGAAVASGNNAIALGSNSVADRDNSVSVGAVGSERQVTNVAAGTAATDAANVGQLNAVSSSVTSLSASAIKYDTNADGTPDYANATLGNGNTGTALHNVAAGTNDMDAVNLSQVNNLIGQVTNLANNAYNPLFTADGDRNTEIATSSGTHSVASGANAIASGVNSIASGATSVASGTNAVAIGANTSATANNAVAVGANASATASNAVALGAGSVADRANAVSVGTTNAGGQRQITNVAAGTDGMDAVNVNQMQQSVNTGVKSAKGYTDALRSDMNTGLSLANNHINSVGAMSSAMAMMAGSAAAIADRDNRFAAGTGVYRNKAAIALGFQKRFGTNMVITVGGSTTGEESTGGAGFAFGF
jgi:trimeric autotransporter adhesin